MISVRDILPAGWRDLLAEKGPVGIGLDPATTAKKTSNPTGLALVQQCGADFIARLVLRFKTTDPHVIEALLRELCRLPHGLRVRKICADATSERFFVAQLKTALAGETVVVPVIGSESVKYQSATLTMKAFLGNQLVNTIEDGHLLLPNEKWLERDLRQVKRKDGSFEADVDEGGNHADCFDAIKLALHALVRLGGPVEAAGARVGGFGSAAKVRWWKNPLARGGHSQRMT